MMTSKLILAITDQETNAQIKAVKPDMLELRVDLFKKLDIDYARKQFEHRRALKLPLILTVRNQIKEGACKEFPDAKKFELLQSLLPLSQWVDIELASSLCPKVVALVRTLAKKIIVSTHDFKGTPVHLSLLLKKALSARADMVKIATYAKTQEDLMRMVEFAHHHRKQPLVTMCLGPLGGLSRLILPAAGTPWIYTFLSKPTAPGQVDIKTLQSHLKFYYPSVLRP